MNVPWVLTTVMQLTEFVQTLLDPSSVLVPLATQETVHLAQVIYFCYDLYQCDYSNTRFEYVTECYP